MWWKGKKKRSQGRLVLLQLRWTSQGGVFSSSTLRYTYLVSNVVYYLFIFSLVLMQPPHTKVHISGTVVCEFKQVSECLFVRVS